MKKLVLTTLAACAFTAASFAQGTVTWANVSGNFAGQTNSTVYSTFGLLQGATGFGTAGNTLGNNAANNATLGYQGYYYELLVGSSASAPTTVAGLSAWTDTGLQASNSIASNGRITQMADDGVAGNTQATANGWPSGVTTNVILVGWSANLGSTWAAALGNLGNAAFLAGLATPAYFGVSSVGSLAAQAGNPGVTVFGVGPGQINNVGGTAEQLNILGVPEPGTLALAALGGASLLLFRRKK